MKRQKIFNAHPSDDEDDDFYDEYPLLPVRSPQKNGINSSPASKHQVSLMEAQVLPDDTLQAIALRFHCSVSELKRINNILRENEIFAKKTIKIPITPHSVLLETLPAVHKSSGRNSPKSPTIHLDLDKEISILNPQELQDKLKRAVEFRPQSIINNDAGSSNHISQFRESGDAQSVNDVIFNSVLAPNERTVVDKSLFTEEPVTQNIVNNRIGTSGSDWGLKWTHLLFCLFILCLIGPLIYIFYIAEHPEKFHHGT